MNDAIAIKPPAWFWAVAVLALLWECVGCAAYVTQVGMGPEQLAQLPPGQAELWKALPVWVTSAYAIAVWSGLVGAVALLMRRTWAKPLFICSLIAVLIQFGYSFGVAKAHELVGPSAWPLPVAIVVIGAALVWFSGLAIRNGWLR